MTRIWLRRFSIAQINLFIEHRILKNKIRANPRYPRHLRSTKTFWLNNKRAEQIEIIVFAQIGRDLALSV